MNLRGRTAIVTGAARGMGREIAERFAREGASVVVADIDADAGRAVAASLADGLFVELDVGDEAAWQLAVTRAIDRFGTVDVLVNNAGIVHHAALIDTTQHDFERVVRINQTGPMLGMQAVVPPMRVAGRGSIINVSSVRGLSGANGLLAYTATKFALRGMTKVAALELGQFGIRVNSIHPGAVATEGVLGSAVDDLDAIDARFTDLPIQRIGRPADVAAMAAFLAGDDSGYCTGAEFVVDGGATAGVRRPGAPGY